MDNLKAKMLEGYMTLEASFIIPFSFMVSIIIIIFTFFLYNSVVLGQACYQAALRGAQQKNIKNSTVEIYVREEADKLLERQVYMYQKNCDVNVSLLDVKVTAGNSIINSLSTFGIYKKENISIKDSKSAIRLDPAGIIRRLLK